MRQFWLQGGALAFALMLAVCPASAEPITVMPLGDSITVGWSAPGGYRSRLYQLMVGSGFEPDFVGSQQTNPDAPFLADPDHEAHSGWEIDDLSAQIDGWLATYSPNVVILSAGTNDIWQGVSATTARDRLAWLINEITTDLPDSLLIVGNLVPRTDSASLEAEQQAFNALIPALVDTYAQQGDYIIFADLHSALGPGDLFDGVHPNQSGADKVADVLNMAFLIGSQSIGSLVFSANAASDFDYGQQSDLPPNFGGSEFTVELWVRPDDSYPVGSTSSGANQLTNWAQEDPVPYSTGAWWSKGNFLLDGYNYTTPANGSFGLQFYGGGRLRWTFGDGSNPGSGDVWSIAEYPATNTASLVDGDWHQVTLVRRWEGTTESRLELWVDGAEVHHEISPVRTDMRPWWDSWSGFPATLPGWTWGSQKFAADGVVSQVEDFKGQVDELRFWDKAKTAAEIASDFAAKVDGTETDLDGWYAMNEGSGTESCDQVFPLDCVGLFVPQTGGFWSSENAPIDGIEINEPPLGNAGATQVLIDEDQNGFEMISLNGTASTDSDGTIVDYTWREGLVTVATGPAPSISLDVGLHSIVLTVTDDDGAKDASTVSINVNPTSGEQTTIFETIVVNLRNAEWHPSNGQTPAHPSNADALCVGADANGSYELGLEFPLNVPRAASIASASISFEAASSLGASPDIDIRAYDVTNAPPFIAGSPASLSSYLPLSNVSTDWTPPVFVPNSSYAFSNLVPLVQNRVNQLGWREGNVIGFIFDPGTTPAGNLRCIKNFGSGSPAMLTVTYRVEYAVPSLPEGGTAVLALCLLTSAALSLGHRGRQSREVRQGRQDRQDRQGRRTPDDA